MSRGDTRRPFSAVGMAVALGLAAVALAAILVSNSYFRYKERVPSRQPTYEMFVVSPTGLVQLSFCDEVEVDAVSATCYAGGEVVALTNVDVVVRRLPVVP